MPVDLGQAVQALPPQVLEHANAAAEQAYIDASMTGQDPNAAAKVAWLEAFDQALSSGAGTPAGQNVDTIAQAIQAREGVGPREARVLAHAALSRLQGPGQSG